MLNLKFSCFQLIFLLLITPGFSQTIQEVIQSGNMQILKSMVSQNPELLKLTNDNENSCLHLAARAGFQEIVKFLIQKGADVNSKNIADETPLHFAAAFGHLNVAEILLQNGAEIDAITYDKSTPLLYAARFGNLEVIRFLVENGADVNFADILDYKPLDFATAFKNEEMIQFLIGHGAVCSQIPDPIVFKLSNTIYRITFPYAERSNMAVLTGSDGLLLVDTGSDERQIDKLYTALNNLDSGKIKYILNTHLHPDHIAGNEIGEGKVPIINFNNLNEMVAENIITISGPLTGKTGKTLDTVYEMTFNQEKILIIPYPGVHTNEDMLVYFADIGIVHTGDLLIKQSFPSVFQNVSGYLDLLAKMTDIFPESTIFICGHGEEATYKDLVAYNSLLDKTDNVITNQLKADKDIKEIRKAKELQGYDYMAEFIPMLNINYWIDAHVRQFKAEK